MNARRSCALGLACLVLLSVQVSECVRITELHVPEVVEHNTNTSAVLDCQYDLDGQRDINILTVRWFFKDDFSAPVYQWVKGAKPSSGGALKGLVHLDHEASDDPLMKHRALSISNPTIELGGKYTCKVSTDVGGTATQSGNMIVYAPVRTMNLTEDKPSPTSVNITCLVEGVYPAPKLELFVIQEGKPDSRKALEDVTRWQESTEDSLFDAMAHVTIEDSSLKGNTEFECVMSVPHTPYTEKRVLTYSYGDSVSPTSSVINETQLAPPPTNVSGTEDLAPEYGPNGVLGGAVLAASKEKGAASRSVLLSSGLLSACLLLVVIFLQR